VYIQISKQRFHVAYAGNYMLMPDKQKSVHLRVMTL